MLQIVPDLRVVIPAYRGEATIRACVSAVGRAAAGIAHEIVVVDDGGNRDLRGELSGLPVLLTKTSNSGSAARARNLGAEGFAGQYLIFIDADVIIALDCIIRLLAPLRSGKADAAVGNYTRDISGLTFGSSYKQLYVARVYERRTGYIENEFWTAVGAVSASAFFALGGFDGSFVGAAGEDVAFGCRLSLSGYRVVAVPDAVGQHRHPMTVRQVLANDWRKGNASIAALRGSDIGIVHTRHATYRDMIAVLLVSAGAASPGFGMLLFSQLPMLAVPPLLFAYLVVRRDIVWCFASRGLWFLIRAAPLMAALDLIRAACVARIVAQACAASVGRIDRRSRLGANCLAVVANLRRKFYQSSS